MVQPFSITPCEEMVCVDDALAAQAAIEKEIVRLQEQVTALRKKQIEYHRVAHQLCEQHEYERSPYDPYSPLFCVHCRHQKH
tara:strand:+ start:2517 stop:2762 length:246 start_codon:yes stop_codon:yes gene_type:complete